MATKSMKKSEEPKNETSEVKVKKFDKDELIPCRSLTNGELLMIGKKTGNLYRWADFNDIQDVEYDDLVYDTKVAGNSSFSLYPRFMILDDDFIEQNPKLNDVYSKLYTAGDLCEMFKLPVSQMKSIIESLPSGVRNTVRGLASTAIRNGELDSVAKIGALDNIFGTMMLKTLVEN